MADANNTPGALHPENPSDTGPTTPAGPKDVTVASVTASTVTSTSTTETAALGSDDVTADIPSEREPATVMTAAEGDSPTTPFITPDFNPIPPQNDESTLDFLDDVELNVKVELGRTEMLIEDVLRLGVGAVVELDKVAGDPVDIYCNERLVARGEVLVLNDTFCVRVNDIVSPVPEDEAQR